MAVAAGVEAGRGGSGDSKRWEWRQGVVEVNVGSGGGGDIEWWKWRHGMVEG